jgi:hypothetical protein
MSEIYLKRQYLSQVIGCKQLKIVDGQVCHQGEPVVFRWCQWSPGPDDVKGVDVDAGRVYQSRVAGPACQA